MSQAHKYGININDIDAFVFDFDGVLTNNLVYLDQNGKELVSCSRADGLAFDVLRKLEIPTYILSTEKNPVVTARANKLMVRVLQGQANKVESLTELAKSESYNLKRMLYVGNDLNDYTAIQRCGYSACPADSHRLIKESATIILNTNGGSGVVRELLEDVFHLNFIEILYP